MVFSEPDEIARAKKLFQDGKVTEALELVDDFEGKKGISQNERIACYIVKSSIYERIGEKEEFLQYAKKITQESQELKKNLLLVDAYIQMARAYTWYTKERGPDYEKSLKLIVKCEELIETFTHISQVELTKRRVLISWIKALIFDERGEIDEALKFAENSLTLAKKLNHKVDIIWALGIIGQIYHNNGELKLALKAYEEGLVISEKIDYKMMIESCHNGIGLIYSSQGELDQGINHLEQALVIAKEINYEFGIAACHINLGLLYQQQGNYDRAQEFLKKSFKMFKSIGSPGYTSLDSLFHLTLEKGDLEEAKNYLDQLKQLNEKLSSKDINIIYRIDRAIFLKMSPRSLNRGKAEEILKEIANEEIINYDAHLIALLNLCDLLLSELSNTGILEIIEDLNSYIAKLLSIAEKNHSYLANFVSVANTGKSETLKDVKKILDKYIKPFTPTDTKPKTEKEKERSRKQAEKLNQEVQQFLSSDKVKDIIDSSVSSEEAQSKINAFLK